MENQGHATRNWNRRLERYSSSQSTLPVRGMSRSPAPRHPREERPPPLSSRTGKPALSAAGGLVVGGEPALRRSPAGPSAAGTARLWAREWQPARRLRAEGAPSFPESINLPERSRGRGQPRLTAGRHERFPGTCAKQAEVVPGQGTAGKGGP